MKYISLLGIITIIALCAEFVLQMSGGDAIESFNAGRETGAQQAESGASYVHSFLLPVKAKVIPEGMEGEATLQLADGTKTVPYSIAEVKCEVRPSWFIAIALTFGSFFVALIAIYSIYCLIRLLIRVAKRDIFSRRNVYWIRWFAYVNAGVYLGLMLFEWLLERDAVSQLRIPGYQVIGIEHTVYDFSSFFVIVLLAEVYAVAVKIKEEQDLTI